MKKRFSYLLGAVLAFVFANNGFAEMFISPDDMPQPVYASAPLRESIINLSIILLPIIFILSLIIGLIIYFKKKKKNAKKDEKTV